MAKRAPSRLAYTIILGFGMYSGYSFYDKFILPTEKLKTAPENSLLAKRCYKTFDKGTFEQSAWNDCYQINKKNIKIINGISDDIIINELIGASFYTSSMFKMEKYLLNKIGVWFKTEQDILNSKFNINDRFGIWKVVAKANNELLLEWNDQYSKWIGLTYLSANIVPSITDNNQNNNNNVQYVDINIKFGSGILQPRPLSFLATPFTTFHGVYSRMLLVSTTEKLLSTLTSSK